MKMNDLKIGNYGSFHGYESKIWKIIAMQPVPIKGEAPVLIRIFEINDDENQRASANDSLPHGKYGADIMDVFGCFIEASLNIPSIELACDWIDKRIALEGELNLERQELERELLRRKIAKQKK